jgi:catechol 2,3-dioxygenase-like lactoylglutathione lyase family enzyme
MSGPLGNAHTVTKLPAQNLERARAFYRDKLGLEPVEERTGGHRPGSYLTPRINERGACRWVRSAPVIVWLDEAVDDARSLRLRHPCRRPGSARRADRVT